jgi:DNA-binding GntR family transcriptional regulator
MYTKTMRVEDPPPDGAVGTASTEFWPPQGDELPTAKSEEAYRLLRAAILSGEHPPGTRLKEIEVGQQLGMSRTPIREAFRQLHLDSLVSLVPRSGAVVRGWTAADVEEVFALRAVLEGFCASRAAVLMSAPAVVELAELHEELEQRSFVRDVDAEELTRLNSLFHRKIVEGSGNRRIEALLDKITGLPVPWRQSFWDRPRQREAAAIYHREIVEAIRTHDAVRADAVMRSHIYAAKDYFAEAQRSADLQRTLRRSGESPA